MTKTKKTPELRFRGFTGDWEENSAGKVFAPYVDKNHPSLTVLSASQEQGMIGREAIGLNIFHNEKNEVTYKRVLPGQFVIHLRSFQGGFAHSNIEGITSPAYTIIGFKENEKHYDFFWKYIFNSERFIRRLETVTYGIRDGRSISYNDFSLLIFNYAQSEEQTQIGSFFQNLDTLIALHQRKQDKLCAVKKAMLEKMFPKEGADVPEIRLKGFTGKWIERSWEDIVDVSTDMVDPRDSKYDELFHIGPGNIESFTGRLLSNVLKIKECNFKSGKFYFKKGDIIYGKIRPQLAKYIIAPCAGLTSADAYVLTTHNGLVQNFLFTVLQTSDFYNYSVSVSTRTGMPKINREELDFYSFLAPNRIEEQSKIAAFFQHLDSLISLHQRELDKLKNIKKACLEKMFI